MCEKCDKIIEKALEKVDAVGCSPDDYRASLREAISEIGTRIYASNATEKRTKEDNE